MNLFEKEFSWLEFVDKCAEGQALAIISNTSQEKRNYLQGFLDAIHKKCNSTDIALLYDPDKDILRINSKEFNVPAGIKELLDSLSNSPLIINISTMNLRLLGALLKYLRFADFSKVYCLYTEPKKYARNRETGGDFDLYRRMKSYDPIQGYVSTNVENKPEKWVPFLGFEGDRAMQIRELYDFDDCVPVITLPSYKPAWQNFIIRENLSLLNGVGSSSIHYVEADSILDAYDKIEKLSNLYSNSLLRISPFGTKINSLGILLYALTHEGEIDIVYDNPIEDGAAISEDIGQTHIFDISEYIQNAKERE